MLIALTISAPNNSYATENVARAIDKQTDIIKELVKVLDKRNDIFIILGCKNAFNSYGVSVQSKWAQNCLKDVKKFIEEQKETTND